MNLPRPRAAADDVPRTPSREECIREFWALWLPALADMERQGLIPAKESAPVA